MVRRLRRRLADRGNYAISLRVFRDSLYVRLVWRLVGRDLQFSDQWPDQSLRVVFWNTVCARHTDPWLLRSDVCVRENDGDGQSKQ